jgi:hypothetical protein
VGDVYVRKKGGRDAPKGIPDDEEADVLLVRIAQDLVRLHLDHFTRSEDDLLAIKGLLQGPNRPDSQLLSSLRPSPKASFGKRREGCTSFSLSTIRMDVYASR